MACMRQGWRTFVRMPSRRQALAVCCASLLLRVTYLGFTGTLTAAPPEFNEQVRMARYLLHGTGFVSPIGPERHDPSCWYAPGYIAVLAAVFWVFGEGTSAAWVAARLLNLAALSAALGLWTLLARFYLGRRVAAVAAVLMVLSPSLTAKSHDIWDTFAVTFAAALCLSVFSFTPPRRWTSACAAGMLCGATALINPCFTLCYPAWALRGWRAATRARNAPPSGRIGYLVAVVVGFAVVVCPWTLRNRWTFGEWMYLRGNLPFELWSGNAPWTNGFGVADGGKRLRHPVFDPDEALRLVAMGEYPYIRQCRREVTEWIRERPGECAERTLRRIAWFWLGRFAHDRSGTHSLLKAAAYTLPGALALLAALLLWPRRSVRVLVWTLMIFPLPYYICLVMARYRLPIEPLVLVMAAAGALAIFDRWRRLRLPETDRGAGSRQRTGR